MMENTVDARRKLLSLGLEFFKDYGMGDPRLKLRHWQDFINHPRHAACLDHEDGLRQCQLACLGITVGVDRRTVLDWRSSNNSHRVRQLTRLRLHTVAVALGMAPPRPFADELGPVKGHHQASHVALLVPSDIVSQAYYLEVTDSLAREATAHGLYLSIHQVPRKGFEQWLELTMLKFYPDGIIMLRITPTRKSLDKLLPYQKPVVLIHADRQTYPEPVLANLVPDQSTLEEDLRAWLQRHLPGNHGFKARVVLATLPVESEEGEFPASSNASRSIRNDRIRRVREALSDYSVRWIQVRHYAFDEALDVWKKNRHAEAWVCLSDQLAVGIKHLLIAAGEPWQGRIVGFDGSELARREKICSFSQGLDALGAHAIQPLCGFFGGGNRPGWPRFDEIAVSVKLR